MAKHLNSGLKEVHEDSSKRPPAPKGSRGGSHLRVARQNLLSRRCPRAPGQVLTSCPQPQGPGLQLGCELERSGDVSTQGGGGQPGQSLPKAESIQSVSVTPELCGLPRGELAKHGPFSTTFSHSKGEPKGGASGNDIWGRNS